MSRTRFYAHSIEGAEHHHWHGLKDHLVATAKLAGKFASSFRSVDLGQAAGLLHDIGKYSDPFQRRLRGEPVRVDHSTAGAKEAVSLYGPAIGRILAFVIAGHHAGLPDYGSPVDEASLSARLNKDVPAYGAYKQEIGSLLPSIPSTRLPMKPNVQAPGFSLQFYVRMLFSCLVDADYLDTESAVNPEKSRVRGKYRTLSELKHRLEQFLEVSFGTAETTSVNRLRAEILEKAKQLAAQPPGLFTLTVPTGGGKTLASLAFALRHAVANGLQRVIYVIPYTSIIEQNAQVFRNALGAENVLEHHSNFDGSTEDEESPEDYRLRLAQENWDAPIIATTNVQFFESLFSHKPGRCRKLHNIADSVVILDEAQMIPTSYLKPCLWALQELIENYNVSAVLCTATQPRIRELMPIAADSREIAPQPRRLYKAFRRVRVNSTGDLDDATLAQYLNEHRQALCIVNTRAHAAALYERIRGDGAYHLSARMYPAHRSQKLQRIRGALKQGETCRVVSTQLIEAGVDVDFPVVYRALAGVDSIAQAAGRCNREGRLKEGTVFVFRPESKYMPRGWFQRTAAVTEIVLREHDDVLSLDAVDAYFHLLYELEGDKLDEHDVIQRFEERATQLAFPFREVGETFQLIDSPMVPVIVPRDPECITLLKQAWRSGPTVRLSRRLQPYTVQVYQQEMMDLSRQRAIEIIAGHYTVLRDLSLYDEEVGLTLSLPTQIKEILMY